MHDHDSPAGSVFHFFSPPIMNKQVFLLTRWSRYSVPFILLVILIISFAGSASYKYHTTRGSQRTEFHENTSQLGKRDVSSQEICVPSSNIISNPKLASNLQGWNASSADTLTPRGWVNYTFLPTHFRQDKSASGIYLHYFTEDLNPEDTNVNLYKKIKFPDPYGTYNISVTTTVVDRRPQLGDKTHWSCTFIMGCICIYPYYFQIAIAKGASYNYNLVYSVNSYQRNIQHFGNNTWTDGPITPNGVSEANLLVGAFSRSVDIYINKIVIYNATDSSCPANDPWIDAKNEIVIDW
ncbi:hypothetical protein V1514DRAFT_335772 [Lipomyces japonicus]|uniref:uncharacterized protein n=1 Tax=Lipomyces japonicus TaxID=56871 RepID=UPI0034CED41C